MNYCNPIPKQHTDEGLFIRRYRAVFRLKMKANEKLVLLALAFLSDDNGERVSSDLQMVAKMANVDDLKAKRAIRFLEQNGYIEPMEGTGRRLYRINVEPLIEENPDDYVPWATDVKGRVAPPGWHKTRLIVFERDNYTCQYCGAYTQKPHCDHVTPHSRGGSDFAYNLVTSCAKCNMRKGAKSPEEWRSR